MLYETRWHNRSAAQFIHDSKCGTDGYDLKICCALDNESSGGLTQPTPPPTTTERTDYPPRLPRNCGRSNSTHTRVVGGAPAELGINYVYTVQCKITIFINTIILNRPTNQHCCAI